MDNKLEDRVKELEDYINQVQTELKELYFALHKASLVENDTEKWDIIRKVVRPFKSLYNRED